jgi:hypothetical protein
MEAITRIAQLPTDDRFHSFLLQVTIQASPIMEQGAKAL